MKKSKIVLSLNKKVMSTLNPSESTLIMGGTGLAYESSGSMMCLPDPDTSVAQCPTASNQNLCATQVKPPCT